MRLFLIALIGLFLLPFGAARAAELPPLEEIYDTEIHLKDVVFSPKVPSGKAVLGISSDTEVAKKLDSTFKSYFRDFSIKPPVEWYVSEDYDDTSVYTFIVDPDMRAEISIERFDGEGISQEDLAGYIKTVCTRCGYKIVDSGKGKLGKKIRADYAEATNGSYHSKVYAFVKSDIAYLVILTTAEEDWDRYKGIMEKSVKTIKLHI